jgi:hypothetical protein
MEIADIPAVLVRRARVVQPDRGAHDLDFLGVGCERLRRRLYVAIRQRR